MRFYRYFKENPPPGTERIKSNDIILRVCDFFGHPVDFVMEKSRKQEYVNTRYIIAYVLAHDGYLNMSLSSIAFAIGKRDHTTIIHGLKRIKDQLDTYEHFRELIREVFIYVYGSDIYLPTHVKNLMKIVEDND